MYVCNVQRCMVEAPVEAEQDSEMSKVEIAKRVKTGATVAVHDFRLLVSSVRLANNVHVAETALTRLHTCRGLFRTL